LTEYFLPWYVSVPLPQLKPIPTATDPSVSCRAASGFYNLKQLADFDGNYAAGGAGGTIGEGAGVTAMKNQNGVEIDLKSTTQGASLKLAAEGIKLSIVK
jgi:hypothetical protein